MSRKQLTSKQHSFLEYLAEHVRKAKVWPTYREIVDHFDYRSPNSVTQNLQALARKGYLTRDDHGYRLVGQRTGLIGGGFPVQGVVERGQFERSLSIEEITLRDLFPTLADAYAIRMEQPVRGVDVHAGDYVLVCDEDIEEGGMVFVLVDGEPAVCRAFQEDALLRLQYPDGEEVHLREGEEDVQVMGPYIGHINHRGLFRLPGVGRAEPSRTAPSGPIGTA